jgi:hypothetical protein
MEENTIKSTSERLLEILTQLSKDQLRYVVASMEYPTKLEAAESVGIKPNTAYKWPPVVDEAISLMAIESTAGALAIRRRNLVKAMAVKANGLDSDDEKIRQSAATELIEWELGKAAQPVTGKDGGAIEARVIDDQRFDRAISTLADAIRESLSGTGSKADGEMDTAK